MRNSNASARSSPNLLNQLCFRHTALQRLHLVSLGSQYCLTGCVHVLQKQHLDVLGVERLQLLGRWSLSRTAVASRRGVHYCSRAARQVKSTERARYCSVLVWLSAILAGERRRDISRSCRHGEIGCTKIVGIVMCKGDGAMLVLEIIIKVDSHLTTHRRQKTPLQGSAADHGSRPKA